MSRCEICGIEELNLELVLFKGRKIYACKECINSFKLVRVIKGSGVDNYGKSYSRQVSTHKPAEKGMSKKVFNYLFNDYELVENYNIIIKAAREKMGLTQEVLARKLKVKVSIIKRVEGGRLVPPVDLARKIEKTLNISILKKAENNVDYKYITRKKGDFQVRLGDFM